MNHDDSIFKGIHESRCSLCHRDEPKNGLPGWPNNGRFLVISKGKICANCLREAMKKKEMLDKGENLANYR